MNTPAFPNPRWEGWGSPQEGMTLRDYFAAKAMQSISVPTRFNSANEWTLDTSFDFAKLAYEIADAMLKAREQ